MTTKGFKRFEGWVHEDDLPRVRVYVDRLIKTRLGEPLRSNTG